MLLEQHYQMTLTFFLLSLAKKKKKNPLINRKKKKEKKKKTFFIPSLTSFRAGITTIHLGRPVILTKSPLPGPLQNKRSRLI